MMMMNSEWWQKEIEEEIKYLHLNPLHFHTPRIGSVIKGCLQMETHVKYKHFLLKKKANESQIDNDTTQACQIYPFSG